MTKIMMEGEYQTRDGQKRRVLCVDAPGRLPVIAISQSGQVYRYLDDGRSSDDACDQPFDLVPVRKRHKRTYWLVHHVNGFIEVSFREPAWKNLPYQLAITGPHQVDFVEGEGL